MDKLLFKKEVKKIILEKLKDMITWDPKQNKTFQYNYTLIEEIAKRLDLGISFVSQNNMSIIEVIEDLKESKIIVQGNISMNFEPGYIQLTDYGINCLKNDSIYIYDPEEYIQKLLGQVPEINEVALKYFIESIKTFRTNFLLSSTVCLGVTSEKIILDLIESYKNSTFGDRNKKKLEKEFFINKKFNIFYKNIMNDKDTIKNSIANIEELMEKINYIFKNIKENRDDAGHPTGKNFDKDELESFIRLFGKYARIVYDLKHFFDKNSIK
jgi:hypothetical protein